MELSKKHAISLFLGGLKMEISTHIMMFTLDTLNDAYYMAKMQEQTIVAMKSRYGPVLTTPRLVSNVFNKPVVEYQRTSGNNVVMPNTSSRNGVISLRKRLTKKELEKRANHMCFYCDEKYFPGHKCCDQLHSLEVVIKGTEDTGEEVFEECTTETMRIRGYVGKQMRICPLKVDVVDGNILTSSFMCKDFKRTLQGLPFVTDMMNLTMEFDYDNSKVLLRGTSQSSIQWMQGKGELMVKELLDSRVIRPSQSLFSSPIIMVKKKDGSWRMCVDYRQLNKHTDKDKFPIPMIEELIEEPQGSIKDSWQQDQTLKELIEKLKGQTNNSTKYAWSNGQLRRKGKLMVGKVDQLRKQLFLHYHGDVVGGHSVAILERRLGNVNNKPEVFVLVQWSNRDKEEAT
nr:reverse transcriptase [Tanacetum cinerariifolium]